MNHISGTKKADNDCVCNNNNENSLQASKVSKNSLQASKVSKEHKQASKLQNLGTRIPISTHKRLLQFVLAKHGKINGALAMEVTNAIESWISKQQQTTSFAFSSSTSGRPRADKMDKLRQISMRLKQLNSFPHVNHFTLIHTVENTLGGCDKRTLKNYLVYIKKLSKDTISTSGTGYVIDVTKFVERIQGDDW